MSTMCNKLERPPSMQLGMVLEKNSRRLDGCLMPLPIYNTAHVKKIYALKLC
jgi:hypothetical protein